MPARPACQELRLQGLTMRGDGPALYGITAVEGWESADASGGTIPNRYSDGGIEGEVLMGSRSIVIEGDIDAPSHEEFLKARAGLERVLTSPRWDWLRVTHHDEDMQIRVSRLRRPQVTPMGPSYGIFTLQLESAGYPRLGVDEGLVSIPLGSSAPVVNAGDYPAVLEAMFYGPLTQPRLRFGGDLPGTWRYGANINAGQRLQVEFDRRIVRNPDTQGHSRVYASGDWPRLTPGQTTFHLEGSGSGRVELKWRSAWN